MGPVLLWGPPLGDDPGAAVKSSSLLVVSTLNSTDIFLILAGEICYLPNSGWALAVKIKILGFPDRAILLIQTLHYMVINGYNGRNPRCDNNLGKLERYRLVTIGGGERDWSRTSISSGLYSEFLDGIVLQVSSCQLKVSSRQLRVSS